MNLFHLVMVYCAITFLYPVPSTVLQQRPGGGRGSSTTHTVRPGEDYVNRDKVRIHNHTMSNSNINVTPGDNSGDEGSMSSVRLQKDPDGESSGRIDGLDENDFVSVGSGWEVNITGEGGLTVDVDSGSSGFVTNNGSKGDITVDLPGSNNDFTVGPGLTRRFPPP